MVEKVLQFGTGNFLRGFFDPFLDRMNKRGTFDGSAVIVSPTNSAQVDKINAQHGKYHLLTRGTVDHSNVETLDEIDCVSRAINPYVDFNAFLSLAKQPELRFIVSNTTEAGIAFDASCAFSDRPQASFPGKLTRFLFERYAAHLPGFIILPCELIDRNADLLKEYVLKYAVLWGLPQAFIAWINNENRFCNTLVDRIVTGYPSDAEALFEKTGGPDALLDTAEPYHLWVIEGAFEKEFPLQKTGFNVIWTTDVTPYKKMKVRILNGLHTSMVFPGLLLGKNTVKDCMDDPLLRKYIDRLLKDCILPTMEQTPEIDAFASAVVSRFENPYLNHKLKSISLNSVSKFSVRILPTLTDIVNGNLTGPEMMLLPLAALIYYYKNYDVQDNAGASVFITEKDLHSILCAAELWGQNLCIFEKPVKTCFEIIQKQGIAEAIRWSLS